MSQLHSDGVEVLLCNLRVYVQAKKGRSKLESSIVAVVDGSTSIGLPNKVPEDPREDRGACKDSDEEVSVKGGMCRLEGSC